MSDPDAAPRDPMTAYLDTVMVKIATHGWAVQGVMGDQTSQPFAYTIGLAAHDHPEFLIYGLEMETSLTLLNDMAARVRDQQFGQASATVAARFAAGTRITDLISGYDAVLVQVHPIQAREHLSVANVIHQIDRIDPDACVEALQIVWPDRAGLFPWEPACSVAQQPVLGDLSDPS